MALVRLFCASFRVSALSLFFLTPLSIPSILERDIRSQLYRSGPPWLGCTHLMSGPCAWDPMSRAGGVGDAGWSVQDDGLGIRRCLAVLQLGFRFHPFLSVIVYFISLTSRGAIRGENLARLLSTSPPTCVPLSLVRLFPNAHGESPLWMGKRGR
ncbi:hypothetical protein FA13DRAFT_207608 [Coprinellus micaceus]|uniref:Uncharacterized protein n=1 Tax=Coprinellus micaceus TaxID=71717 RepID=A0A4Y7SFG9_COPMI|nr:hypothetical protein FA13DRAFT_207608 [Coprinellus micaceus]